MRHLFSFSRLSRVLFRTRWRAASRAVIALSRVWSCIVHALFCTSRTLSRVATRHSRVTHMSFLCVVRVAARRSAHCRVVSRVVNSPRVRSSFCTLSCCFARRKCDNLSTVALTDAFLILA
jgi:hypothetical protein